MDIPSSIPVALGVIVVCIVLVSSFASRIRKAGPNQVMVISGLQRIVQGPDGTRYKVGFRLLKGGATFIWPFIERIDRLSSRSSRRTFRLPACKRRMARCLKLKDLFNIKSGIKIRPF